MIPHLFSRLWPKAVIFMPLSTKSGLIETRGSRAVLSKGGFQLLDFRGLFGTPRLLRGHPGRPGSGLKLTMLVAKQPVRRLVAPIVSPALTSRRALFPPARCQMPLSPFFANCHTAMVAAAALAVGAGQRWERTWRMSSAGPSRLSSSTS